MEMVDTNADLDIKRNWKGEKKVFLNHKYFLKGKSALQKVPNASIEITHDVGQVMASIMNKLRLRR